MINHDDWQWEITNKRTWSLPSGNITITVYSSPIPGTKPLTGMGVDPGRNFGIATLNQREATVYSGTLPKVDKTKKYLYGLSAFELMINPRTHQGVGDAVVEGAAHKMPYGQADLAHNRMGFVIGLYNAGYSVEIIPPATIRVNTLGKGNKGGLEIWPDLNHNGADALACALYAAGLRKKDIEGSHLEK